jgi:hypothetical protein
VSGGHFDYKQDAIADISDEVERLIRDNDSDARDEWGQTVGAHYPPAVVARFRTALRTLRQAAAMVHRIDWLVSGDDGPETFLERWKEEVSKCRAGR